MQIRIETGVTPHMLKAFLDERKLFVPVFFDAKHDIVITINQRNRADAIQVIEWLLTQ